MLYKYFQETQDQHGVSNKDLAREAGISGKHLSEFRNGKANVTLDRLWHLVETLDRLSPGARKDFGLKLAGCTNGLSSSEELSLNNLIAKIPPSELLQVMGNRQLAALLSAFAETLKQEEPNKTPENPTSLRKSPHESNSSKVYKEVMVS